MNYVLLSQDTVILSLAICKYIYVPGQDLEEFEFEMTIIVQIYQSFNPYKHQQLMSSCLGFMNSLYYKFKHTAVRKLILEFFSWFKIKSTGLSHLSEKYGSTVSFLTFFRIMKIL
jgi:hypothetical protein